MGDNSTEDNSSKTKDLSSFLGFRISQAENLDDAVAELFVWKKAKISAKVDGKKKTIVTVDKAALVGILANLLLDDENGDDAVKLLRLHRSCSLEGIDDDLKPRIESLLCSTRSLDPVRWGLRAAREEKKRDEANMETSNVLFMPKNYTDIVKLIAKGQKKFDEPNVFGHVLFWSLACFNEKVYEIMCESNDVQLLDTEEIAGKLSITSDCSENASIPFEQLILNAILAAIIPGKNISLETYKKWPLKRLMACMKYINKWSFYGDDDRGLNEMASVTTVGTIAGMKKYRRMVHQRKSLLEKYVGWIESGVPASDSENATIKGLSVVLNAVFSQAKLAVQYYGMATIRFTLSYILASNSRKWSNKIISEQAEMFDTVYNRIMKEDRKLFPYLGVLNSPRLRELSKSKYRELTYCAIRHAKRKDETREAMKGFGYKESYFKTTAKKSKLKKLMKHPPELSIDEIRSNMLVEHLGLDLGRMLASLGQVLKGKDAGNKREDGAGVSNAQTSSGSSNQCPSVQHGLGDLAAASVMADVAEHDFPTIALPEGALFTDEIMEAILWDPDEEDEADDDPDEEDEAAAWGAFEDEDDPTDNLFDF